VAYSPVELRHVRFGRGLLGYKRASVDRVLEEAVDSFEDVWRERGELTDKVEQLESDLVRYRELEALLRTTLVSAEKAAHELKDQARREAKLTLDEAHAEAREVTRTAVADRERLRAETHRVRALLEAALDTVTDAEPDAEDRREPEAA
jgi:cell division initiation protein